MRRNNLTVAASEIATLEHEAGNDTVELRSSVAEAILSCGKFTEVPGGLWYNIVEELEDNATRGSAGDGDIELSREVSRESIRGRWG